MEKMTKEEIFEIWAPPKANWSPWAKPVLFSQMDAISEELAPAEVPMDVGWAADADRATAIVVDLPGTQGIAMALSLSEAGYRPVPLYNACPQPSGDVALVDVRPIMLALAAGVAKLSAANLPPDAPPAFMLDAIRNVPRAVPAPGLFDNRSISLPTDFPSANLLLSRGLRRVVLVQTHAGEPQADLSHTLRRWQEAGLAIFAVAANDHLAPSSITISRPRAFRVLWYNLLAKFGFISNPLGGFGGHLPMPSSG
jgi:hypothetical protein